MKLVEKMTLIELVTHVLRVSIWIVKFVTTPAKFEYSS